MTRIELVTVVPMPTEQAFDLARDIGAHERSLARTGERAVAGRTHGLVGPGEEVTFEARHLGRWWRLTSRMLDDAWEPPRRFVDEQVCGPFRWFRHEHRFEPTAGGTLMTDVWAHELGWGPLGRAVDVLVVRRLVRRLLADRAAALARMS
jgi:ligand-binding SRPBCC domain-containing protein